MVYTFNVKHSLWYMFFQLWFFHRFVNFFYYLEYTRLLQNPGIIWKVHNLQRHSRSDQKKVNEFISGLLWYKMYGEFLYFYWNFIHFLLQYSLIHQQLVKSDRSFSSNALQYKEHKFSAKLILSRSDNSRILHWH